MLHASTQKLIIKLHELTETSDIAWKDAQGQRSTFETEGYRVEIDATPPSVRLLDLDGRELEHATEAELGAVAWPDGAGTFATHVSDMARRAQRVARGTEHAISRILSSLSAPPRKAEPLANLDQSPPPSPHSMPQSAPEPDVAEADTAIERVLAVQPLARPSEPPVAEAPPVVAEPEPEPVVAEEAAPAAPEPQQADAVAEPEPLEAPVQQQPEPVVEVVDSEPMLLGTEVAPPVIEPEPPVPETTPEPVIEAVQEAPAPEPEPIVEAAQEEPQPEPESPPSVVEQAPPPPRAKGSFGAIDSFDRGKQPVVNAPDLQPPVQQVRPPEAVAPQPAAKPYSPGILFTGISARTHQTIRGEPAAKPTPAPQPQPVTEAPEEKTLEPASSGSSIYKPWA